jgi:hypothetical protein
MPGILTNDLCNELDKACQHSPLNNDTFPQLHREAKASCSADSEQITLFDILVLDQYIGPYVSEYAQNKGD